MRNHLTLTVLVVLTGLVALPSAVADEAPISGTVNLRILPIYLHGTEPDTRDPCDIETVSFETGLLRELPEPSQTVSIVSGTADLLLVLHCGAPDWPWPDEALTSVRLTVPAPRGPPVDPILGNPAVSPAVRGAREAPGVI